MRHRTVAVLGVLAALGCAPGAAAGASSPPATVGHVRVAINSNARISNYQWTANHDRVVILQSWALDALRKLKRANPHVIVLMYKNAAAASSSQGPLGRYATGVSYQQARKHRWLLRNRHRGFFTFSGYHWLWAADIGSPSYQRAWIAGVLADIGSDPWDGVFIDDVNPTIAGHYCVPCVAKYPSDQRYQQAMQSFVSRVGPALAAHHELAIANLGGWSEHGAQVDGWLSALSGGVDEQFVKTGSAANSGYQPPATWGVQLGELQLAESQGKMFFGLAHSSANDEAAAVYGYATELLAADGRAFYSIGPDYANEPWFPEFDYQIGSPSGAYSIDANGVYRRKFSNGLVLVNPTTAPQTVSFDGFYSGSGIKSQSGTTMPPHSGLVLTPDLLTSLLGPI